MLLHKSIAIIALMMSLTACAKGISTGHYKKYMVNAPSNLTVVEEKVVKGSSCGYPGSVSAAARAAIAKSPGATGLKDVTIVQNHILAGISFTLAPECVEVSGIPVK